MGRLVRFPGHSARKPDSGPVTRSPRSSYTFGTMASQVERIQGIESRFLLGDWLVEPSLNRLSRDGVSVQLALKVMDVLLCLADRPGELVSKHELTDAVWQTEYVSDNTLTKRIAELRDALGDDARNPR